MLLKTETYKVQNKLAQYCRDGKRVSIPGAKPDRLPHYRRLVFNVINDSLESAFPISKKYIETQIWEQMVYLFFSSHKCQNAQVWRMPEEFYKFCRENDYAGKYSLPYLNDLLLFEWLEVELYMMEDIPYPEYKPEILPDRKIKINPEYRLIKLEYPVHKIKSAELEKQKGEYFLLLFREKESGRIQFTELSVLFTFLLENIISGEKTLNEIYNDILYIFGINDLELLLENGKRFLTDLQKKGFILGV